MRRALELVRRKWGRPSGTLQRWQPARHGELLLRRADFGEFTLGGCADKLNVGTSVTRTSGSSPRGEP